MLYIGSERARECFFCGIFCCCCCYWYCRGEIDRASFLSFPKFLESYLYLYSRLSTYLPSSMLGDNETCSYDKAVSVTLIAVLFQPTSCSKES